MYKSDHLGDFSPFLVFLFCIFVLLASKNIDIAPPKELPLFVGLSYPPLKTYELLCLSFLFRPVFPAEAIEGIDDALNS